MDLNVIVDVKCGQTKTGEWLTCDFTFFSTVFKSYQDDGQMIIVIERYPFLAGLETETTRLAGQRLTYCTTGSDC